MISVGKAPYRISLLGGGSDLDWFVDKEEYGFSLGYALNKYSYSIIHKLSEDSKYGILNYSSRERYENNSDIVHPLIREAFKYFGINSLLELSSFGFASGGSGLGGSSAFLLSLLSALTKYFEINSNAVKLAHYASEIEINKVMKPIGRQDQYLSALGGLNALRFNSDNKVDILKLSNEKIEMLQRIINSLYIIPSGKNRSADKVLSEFKNRKKSIDEFKEIRSIAKNFLDLDEKRDHILEDSFHKSVKDSWEVQKEMSNVMNELLFEKVNYIDKLIPNNWIRLIGAGSGGYFLVSSKIEEKDINEKLESSKIINYHKAQISKEGVSSEIF